MAKVGSIENINRSILWKKAMQKKKKNGSYDDMVIPIVGKIASNHFEPRLLFLYILFDLTYFKVNIITSFVL